MKIFTIGHGRHAWKDFLGLLDRHGIRFVCDVRNYARSRWPQFNGPILSENLRAHGIGYEHLPECGGKEIAPTEILGSGVDRIVEIAQELPTVIMCSESQPLTGHAVPRANCHRVGLLAPLLRARGCDEVVHILPDGSVTEFDERAVPSIW